MVKRYSYERGDIVITRLDPVEGKELKGVTRPVLVLSKKLFNDLGMVLVAPITQGGDFSRDKGFTIPLMGGGTQTNGIILLNQCRMMDLEIIKSTFKEKVPNIIIEDALQKLQTIID